MPPLSSVPHQLPLALKLCRVQGSCGKMARRSVRSLRHCRPRVSRHCVAALGVHPRFGCYCRQSAPKLPNLPFIAAEPVSRATALCNTPPHRFYHFCEAGGSASDLAKVNAKAPHATSVLRRARRALSGSSFPALVSVLPGPEGRESSRSAQDLARRPPEFPLLGGRPALPRSPCNHQPYRKQRQIMSRHPVHLTFRKLAVFRSMR